MLGLGLLLIAGIWWWGARRSARAPGNAELRESSILENTGAEAEVARQPELRQWGVPPLEPLSIHTADYEPVPALDIPMLADGDAAAVFSATWTFSA